MLAVRENPYFNRTTFAFSSHQHTPNDKSASVPAVTIGADGAYIAADMFTEYAQKGNIYSKYILIHAIDTLLGEKKTLTTNLPAQGVVTVMNQADKNRYVNHILYASPVRRGQGIEIIEDIIPLYGIDVCVKTDRAPKKVYLAPEMKDIPYTYENGAVSYTIEKLDMHAMVVIEF